MKRRRGVALMLALWLIVLLSVLAARVTSSSRDLSGIASNLRADAIARYASESGVVLGVTRVQDSLANIIDVADRAAFLNSLQAGSSTASDTKLGDGRFSIVFVDVNTRLDVNNASEQQLAKLFSFVAGPSEALVAAHAIHSFIAGDPGQMQAPTIPRRVDLVYPASPPGRPLRTLEELRRIPGVSQHLATAAAPYLTVDGDGKINRSAASDTVLAAAAGSLVNEPSRLLIISRGWLNGHPLTHEIQAVYAIEGSRLVLVRWQEREL